MNFTQTPVVLSLNIDCSNDIFFIDQECSIPPWSLKQIKGEFSNPVSRCFGARIGGKLVGYLFVHVVSDEAHIINFGILPDFRGQGIGRFVIQETISILNNEGVKSFFLEVREGNKAAITLYESLGFTHHGIRSKYYVDNGENAILLALK